MRVRDVIKKSSKKKINIKELLYILDKSKINHKNEILKEKTLKDVHIYCKKNKLSGQITGPLIEHYIIVKYNLKKNSSSLCNGDCMKDDKNYEIKVSLGGEKTHKDFNYVQIRLNHNIDYYLLTAYYISHDNIDDLGELYTFLLDKKELTDLLIKYGTYAHGTKNELGNITEDDLKKTDNNKEYALRPKYDGECWKELLEYDIDLDNYFDK
jgi:hypothetical protein